MGALFFCNVDENGGIIESLVGERVIPTKQYEYFFYLANANTEEVFTNIPRYRVINRELTLV
ncbi:hypothetical protein [Bacillus sp. OTU530]|uniref:hypothetical protein n=1 Tax=Bacillus sp. OTU530 TaxID=3043862 RepID=UPI00313E75B0